MAAPGTLTITMQDTGATTVAKAIPAGLTASQFLVSLILAGGVWDAVTQDTLAGATFWPFRYWKKVVTS